jgi:regulator of protease activity HflC (stomatin/prohibitin superfamily)
MSTASTVVLAIVLSLLGLFIIASIVKSIIVVREKEVVIVEHFGKFSSALTAGVHFILPWIDAPKTFSVSYYISNNRGEMEHVVRKGQTRVSTQNEVLDFPRQHVITRDNALIHLDAILNYRIVSPKTMIYACQNLPRMLSKVLQAQIRNIAGTYNVDKIIEDSSTMDRVSGEIDSVARRWGCKVEFVKIQKVETGELRDVLARKKNADLKNKEIIIKAKAHKQTRVIESEGHRDRIMKEAEGEAQRMLSRARGQAQAIVNAARAEARSVKEIARAIARTGENPTKYLLALKYIDALKRIADMGQTEIQFLPHETAFLQTTSMLGLNTVLPRSAAM